MKINIKKEIIIIIILLIFITVYYYINKSNQNSTYKEETNELISKINQKNKTTTGKIINIDYNKFIELYNLDKTSIIFLGSNSCNHCLKTKNNLLDILKTKNITIYYLDVWTMPNKDYNNLQKYYSFSGVPNIIVVKNKQISKKLIGEANSSKLKLFLSNIKD